LLNAQQLLNPEQIEKLNEMIYDVEKTVLETKRVRQEMPDGTVVWKEVVKGEASIYDIEMALESNADYMAFFQKDDGTIITKFDVERKLDNIRKWLYAEVRVRASGKRFSRM